MHGSVWQVQMLIINKYCKRKVIIANWSFLKCSYYQLSTVGYIPNALIEYNSHFCFDQNISCVSRMYIKNNKVSWKLTILRLSNYTSISITGHRVGPHCLRIRSLAAVCNPWQQRRWPGARASGIWTASRASI